MFFAMHNSFAMLRRCNHANMQLLQMYYCTQQAVIKANAHCGSYKAVWMLPQMHAKVQSIIQKQPPQNTSTSAHGVQPNVFLDSAHLEWTLDNVHIVRQLLMSVLTYTSLPTLHITVIFIIILCVSRSSCIRCRVGAFLPCPTFPTNWSASPSCVRAIPSNDASW